MKITSVYLAGSSSEVERAEKYIAKLEAAGINVTSSWTFAVRADGGNPNRQDITEEARKRIADLCAEELDEAQCTWLLMPSEYSHGAFWELGRADVSGKEILVSGQYKRSPFTARATRFETDDDALVYIINSADYDKD